MLLLSEPIPVACEADTGCCLGFRLGLITRSLSLLLVADIPVHLLELLYCMVRVPKGGKWQQPVLWKAGPRAGMTFLLYSTGQRSPGPAQAHGCGEIGPPLGWRNDQEL